MTGISLDTLDAKQHQAIEIIKEAVSGKDGLFALYMGDKPGLVLLHLLRTSGIGKVTVPVINFQFLPMPGDVLRFIDKLRRMWSLDLDVIRFPEKRGMEKYAEEEMLTKRGEALFERDARRVLSSCTAFFEGDACFIERNGLVEFRPLCGFSDEDISAYAERYRLPLCSVDEARTGAPKLDGAPGRDTDLDDKELADRLKKLGYL